MIKESYYYYYQCSSIDTCNLILHRISVTSVQSNWTKCIAAAAPSCKVPTLCSGPAHVLPQLSKMFSRWGSLDPYVMQDSLCPRFRCKLPAQQFCTGHHCAAQHADHATATFVPIGRIYAVRTMTPNNSESLQRRTWLHSKRDYSNQPLDQSVHVLDRPSAGF